MVTFSCWPTHLNAVAKPFPQARQQAVSATSGTLRGLAGLTNSDGPGEKNGTVGDNAAYPFRFFSNQSFWVTTSLRG